MQTYLFYDIESTGLNKCFDQVLQFAAIRTDLNFNVLSEHEFLIRLNPDTIPNPYASITHRISLKNLQHGLNECEAMEKIHALLNTPGTISLGYNTLEFDDEFLRFSFYKNLLTPYTHQYANRCGRMDIYPMTIMYYLYKNDCLNWPMKDKSPSLKLENLNTANKLAKGQAHNAMIDVKATLELARILAKDEKMWTYLTGYFNKKSDQERLVKLPTAFGRHREGIMLLGKLGIKHRFQAPVLYLGEHRHYRNQTIWLRLDLPELQHATLDNFQEKTWTLSKKYGEPGFLLPPTDRFLEKIDSERKMIAEKNKTWLQENPEIFNIIVEHYLEYKYPVYPNTDVDAALYLSDFWSNEDTKTCAQFHKASAKQKADLLHIFDSSNLQEIALRILGRHYTNTLTAEQQAHFTEYVNSIFKPHNPPHDFKGEAHFTLDKLRAECEKIKNERALDAEQKALIEELEAAFLGAC